MSRGNRNPEPAINNLPDEVLLRIILQTISYDDAPHVWFPRRLQHYETRVVTMGVCHKWRQLMETSPELWTSFAIANHWGDQSQENILMPKSESITIWQARSRNRPIHIHLYNGSFLPDSKDGIALMTTLLPSISRWHQIDLALDQKAAEAFIVCDCPTAAGLGIQEIRAASFCEKAETNDQLLVAFGHWPDLQKLVWIFAAGLLTTGQPTFHSVIHLFPWQKLRHISLKVSWTLIQFHSFFNSATCAQLIRLNMRQHPMDSPTFHPHSTIDLPELRYLGIESDSSMYHYVECLNLPNIEGIGLFQKMLALENSWGTDPRPTIPSAKFHRFLIRTAHSLRAMIVHGYPFSVQGTIDLFSNRNLLNIAVFEIDVGEKVTLEEVEYIKSNSLTPPQIESRGKFLGWCDDHARCNTLHEIFPSFDINYHTWLHSNSI